MLCIASFSLAGAVLFAARHLLEPTRLGVPDTALDAARCLRRPQRGAARQPYAADDHGAAPKPAPARPRKPPPLPRANTLAEETAALQLVAVALRAGQLERARAALADFARRFPESQLEDDRVKLQRRLEQLERGVP